MAQAIRSRHFSMLAFPMCRELDAVAQWCETRR
jgi:hypothetical protein